MKKIRAIAVILIMMVILAQLPILSASADECGDFYCSDLPDGTAAITGYWGSDANVIIPNEINGFTITSIGSEAFCWASMESVTIPDSVTSIGSWAFGDCSNLASITIPDSVTSIEDNAFENTAYYNDDANWDEDGVLYIGNHLIKANPDILSGDYTIKDGTKTIADSAFSGCENLQNVTVPNSVTSVGRGAFGECTNLESIIIPDSVTSIGSYAFDGTAYYNDDTNWDENGVLYIGNHLISADADTLSGDYTVKDGTKTIAGSAFCDCTNLESVTIPDSVTSICDDAFSGCESLESVTIPDSVTSICSGAFSYCTSLTSVTIPNSVMSISGDVFCDCTNLESIIIPDSVTSICGGAFYGCTSLQSITMPNSVMSIGRNAFGYCESLESIIIPDSVTSIGEYAFENTAYYNDDTNWGEDGVLYIGNHLIGADSDILSGDHTVKNGTKTIAENAFEECISLTSITIPDSITIIGGYAFYGCTCLESATIPNSVTKINEGAFDECTSLKTVTFIGTENEWNGVSIGVCNDCLIYADIVFAPKADISGDVSGNGKVDSSDLLIMQNIMLGNTEFNENVDFNGDGVFDVADLVLVQLCLLGY